MLKKFTQKGIEKVKDTPQRIERARNNIKSVGGNLKQIHFVFGKYDMVVFAEAPSDEAMAKAGRFSGASEWQRIDLEGVFGSRRNSNNQGTPVSPTPPLHCKRGKASKHGAFRVPFSFLHSTLDLRALSSKLSSVYGSSHANRSFSQYYMYTSYTFSGNGCW